MALFSGPGPRVRQLRERPRTLAGVLALVVAALTCVAFWRIDQYYAHGLTADWYVEHGGQRQRLMRTVE